MSDSASHDMQDTRIASRIDATCERWIESHWRDCGGLALRISHDLAAVVERPGRTRFDVCLRDGQLIAPIRSQLPWLPFDDSAFAFIALDRCVVDADHWPTLLEECARVLTGNGRLLVININPFGWVGCLDRFSGRALAPPMYRLRSELHALDLIDVQCERRLCWPPLPAALIDSIGDGLDLVDVGEPVRAVGPARAKQCDSHPVGARATACGKRRRTARTAPCRLKRR